MSTFFIGDIHGHVDKLRQLLSKLGFTELNGVWQHPVHRAVFVGDLIDRGPGQLETVYLVKAMIDAGMAKAVMGNHELNACAWYLPHPEKPGTHLRKRSDKNRHQHAAFLEETEHDPGLHREIIDWFLTLPLWLDEPGYRVVHACWNESYLKQLQPLLKPGNTLDYDLVCRATTKGSLEYRTVEGLLKGMEVNLPEGVFFYDKENIKRKTTRITWWDNEAVTYKKAAVVSRSERESIPDTPMPKDGLLGYDNTKPLFIGHYWRTGVPALLASHIACVDYSAGKGGDLVAYQWDGETALVEDKFVSTAEDLNNTPSVP